MKSGVMVAEGTAALWRRTLAFAIDCLILGALGMAIIYPLFDSLSALGGRARLLGFAIGSLYFVWFEGGPNRNQSPGKWAMKLKVVRCVQEGAAHLAVLQAWLRYAIIAVPFELHGVEFFDLRLHIPAMPLILLANDTIVMVWETAFIYLLCFNRPSRRSVHDLATNTIVVQSTASAPIGKPVTRAHWYCIAALSTLAIATVTLVDNFTLARQQEDFLALQQAVASMDGIAVTSLTLGNMRFASGSTTHGRNWTAIGVRVSHSTRLSEDSARKIADAVVAAGATHLPHEAVLVNISQTADLGIAKLTLGHAEVVQPKMPDSSVNLNDQNAIQLETSAAALDPETLSLLDQGRYSDLDKKLNAMQARFEDGQLDEFSLRAIYRPFTILTPAQEAALQAWAKASPNSYPAHLALGYHEKVLAWKARGDKYVAETPAENLVQMEKLNRLATRELLISMALTPKPYMSVFHLQDIARLEGHVNDEARLVAEGISMKPDSQLVRGRYLESLLPRWGGSYDEMRAFIDNSRQQGASPECVMRMEITLEGEQAADAWRAKQFAEANRRYLIVLDRASRLGLKSGDYVDDAHRYICTTTKEARFCESRA